MDFHPIADVFPLLEGEEFESLCKDIKAHGLRDPIALLDGKILDGRNRWRACEAAGVKPVWEPFIGKDPFAYVVSKNLKRRHLDESQRAMAAARMARLQKGANQHASIDACSQQDAADVLNVSRPSVQRARKVQDEAEPEIIAQVDAGNIAVSRAAEVAILPKPAQKRVAKAAKEGGKKAAAAAVKEEKSKTPPKNGRPKFDDRPVTDLIGKLSRLFDARADAFGKSPEHQDCLDKMGLVLAAWNRWQKKTAS